jgi:hypothetical protein
MTVQSATMMPDRVARLPRDPRGYPILASITRADGGYDFRGIEWPTVLRLLRERRCGICGESLGYWMTFISGPEGIANRVFSDPAMHPECAAYAVAVCPYLAYARTPRQLSAATPDLMAALDATTLPGHIDAKADRVGQGKTRGYALLPNGLIRAQPFVDVIWTTPLPAPPSMAGRRASLTSPRRGCISPRTARASGSPMARTGRCWPCTRCLSARRWTHERADPRRLSGAC